MIDYRSALSELGKAELSEEENALLDKHRRGKITSWDNLEAELLAVYGAVLGEGGRNEFQSIFLPRARRLYPKPSEAAVIVAYHMHKASWLQPSEAESYFTTALEPERKGGFFRFFR